MALIDPTNPINSENSCQYWQDELKNARVLLNEINKAIQALTIGNHQSYELDTGQSKQRVTRLDINNLNMQRQVLIGQIADLELHPCNNQSAKNIHQAVPFW